MNWNRFLQAFLSVCLQDLLVPKHSGSSHSPCDKNLQWRLSNRIQEPFIEDHLIRFSQESGKYKSKFIKCVMLRILLICRRLTL